MKSYTLQSEISHGGFTKSKIVRKLRSTEKESLELLCHEIQGLVRDSKIFEKQYNALLNYYSGLTHVCTS